MKANFGKPGHVTLVCCAVALVFLNISAAAQSKSYERAFPQSKTEVEKTIARMQAALSGRLPVLDGFAEPGDHPLDRYQRGYYQAAVKVSSGPNGGSLIRVTAKVTAWFTDPTNAHSGYRLLVSNGRIEGDLLDQFSEQLAANSGGNESGAATTATGSVPSAIRASSETNPIETRSSASALDSNDEVITAPSPPFPESSSSLTPGLASSLRHAGERDPDGNTSANGALQAEFDSLQEVFKNQGHPRNLVAVKKSGTPVVATPSLTAKPEFLASRHDEFELLNFNADWVHVRVSGLSRGWIWRNSVEMPEGIPDTQSAPAAAMTPASDLFRVTREETAQFPGDWEPLRSKNVKILTVLKADESATGNAGKESPQERLDYAKFLLEKTYAEMSSNPQGLAGIVVIFDSVDGGMIAAPLAILQQWKAGTLTDSALWHKCFFDPPELLDSTTLAHGL